MAVITTVYPSALKALLEGTVDLDSDTIKMALLDANAAYDEADDQLADVVSNELDGGDGYTAGGTTLGSAAVTVSDGVATLDFANATWTDSTITASNAVIYDDSVSGDPLLAFIAFGSSVSSDMGTFTVAFDTSGVFTLAQAA